jgi:hypothetical protein
MIDEPNCRKRECKHYIGIIQPDDTERSERPACSAYPDGIPEDIAFGNSLHKNPRKDQNNKIVFEKKK